MSAFTRPGWGPAPTEELQRSSEGALQPPPPRRPLLWDQHFPGFLPIFPSMEIFLMRVSSELVEGDGQLLLGGVAIPRLVAALSASAERAGRWPPVRALRLARPPSVAGAAG